MIKNIINKFIIKEYKFKYLIYSILSGILFGLSFQTFNFFVLAWFAFIPLLFCIQKNNLKYSILYGFITGITYSLIAFNWMFLFLLKNTNSFIDSFIVSIIVWTGLTLFFMAWVIILSLTKEKNNLLFIILAASVWTVLEYIRNYYFGSFPINLLGYSQSSFIQIIQFADIFGVYGISFIIILINLLLFYWLFRGKKRYLLSAIFIVCLLLLYGFTRINQISKIDDENEIKIGVVQPNIKQKYKSKKQYTRKTLKELERTGIFFEGKFLDILLYPETILPQYLNKSEDVRSFVNRTTQLAKYVLIGNLDEENYKIYNSIFIVSKNGEIIDKYKKRHLILFGEYIPFQGFLERLFSKFISDNNLTQEIELKVFKLDKYTLGINICSENYYPYLSRELVLKGATLLTTHSNDAWCDGLSYPYQHFIMNIFRAIENRKYLIVAANTGISGVISPTGKVIKQTKNQEQICFEEFVYTNNYITIYDRIGDIFVYLCMLYTGIFLLFAFFLGKRKRHNIKNKSSQ